jgi:hypothetical protein
LDVAVLAEGDEPVGLFRFFLDIAAHHNRDIIQILRKINFPVPIRVHCSKDSPRQHTALYIRENPHILLKSITSNAPIFRDFVESLFVE